jgi:hypothetical protein
VAENKQKELTHEEALSRLAELEAKQAESDAVIGELQGQLKDAEASGNGKVVFTSGKKQITIHTPKVRVGLVDYTVEEIKANKHKVLDHLLEIESGALTVEEVK